MFKNNMNTEPAISDRLEYSLGYILNKIFRLFFEEALSKNLFHVKLQNFEKCPLAFWQCLKELAL